MNRHLGHRSGRAASALAVALIALTAFGIVSYASRHTKNETPAPIARVDVASAPSAIAATTAPEVTTPVATDKTAANVVEPKPADLPARASGMVVGIDPETGRIGLPSAAQREELQRQSALKSPALDRDTPLPVIHKPDGSMMVDLQDRYLEYSVVKIGPDGKTIERCVQGSDLDAALNDDAAAAAAPATASPTTAPSRVSAER